jgi:outer membrane protein OmpA-like peptidoglycan-associated protein
MKHFNKFLLAAVLVLSFSAHAQNSDNPWALSFGVNAVDTRGGASSTKFSTPETIVSQPFRVFTNWNMVPSAFASLSRSVGNNFSIGIQGSVNRITKFVYFNETKGDYVTKNPGDLMYYALDANAKYSFMSLIGSKTIDPSLRLGAGYTMFGDNGYPTLNPGFGVTYWLSNTIGIAAESTYKASQLIGGDRGVGAVPSEPSHFQHSFGITFLVGGKDTDKDGIYDKKDACPEVAGLKQFNGCPDTDGDGIIDGSDSCPTAFGLASLNGCPDKDGDKIADKDDACPDVAGLISFQGCPDTDGDGIADKDDKCPREVGPKANGGCPILDSDKDGVVDKDDDCPTVVGLISNKGCPEPVVTVGNEIIEKLRVKAKSIFFNPGKATFKNGNAATKVSLVGITEILSVYPKNKFVIEGHTDSDGSNVLNQKLSEDRANAVRNFLIEKGVKPENITAVGFGETKPVASNKTKAGKAKNRRTEVRPVDVIK